jgi:predicted pyridoxine 5'-phosphate oxidase superfamily flavin-nucleotide-binding protein
MFFNVVNLYTMMRKMTNKITSKRINQCLSFFRLLRFALGDSEDSVSFEPVTQYSSPLLSTPSRKCSPIMKSVKK